MLPPSPGSAPVHSIHHARAVCVGLYYAGRRSPAISRKIVGAWDQIDMSSDDGGRRQAGRLLRVRALGWVD